MAITASKLREDVYRLLDQVIETGEPLEVERKGRRLQIVVVEVDGETRPSKLDRLTPHPGYIVGDPDDIIHMNWIKYWNPDPVV